VNLVVRGRRVVHEDRVGPAAIHVDRGRIVRVAAFDDLPHRAEVFDAGDLVVLPGLVDTHVHVDEPGRADWEGFASATRAAAAGGITTIVDMPLNSIPATTTPAALGAKCRAAGGQCTVDVGFWGGVVPGNEGELGALRRDGVLGFKCFLAPSGVPEFEAVDEAALRRALPALARLGGAPLLAHAELPAALRTPHGDSRSYRDYAASRPPAAERDAVALLARLCAEFDGRVPIHIVHVAAAAALEPLAAARAAGLPFTAETCPHYLTFTTDEVPDGATEFKCAPPLRTDQDRDALWQALARGALDLVASDHSPSPPGLKLRERGDLFAAWGGIASLQLSLAATWTEADRRRRGLAAVARWMATAPARLAGLAGRKGEIAPGCDADLVLFDPDATFTVDPRRLEHRHPVTPYAGRTLRGVVRRTYLRGEVVYDGGAFPGTPSGRLLLGRDC
jgi:allantoinase